MAPKGLAPENVEGAKGFLGSATGAGGELLGVNSVEGAAVVVTGASNF